MAKKFGSDDLIYSWMRNRNTLEFLGIWEQIHNPIFNSGEFETFRNEAGLNRFHLTPKKWIEANLAFGVDYKDWFNASNKTQNRIFESLVQGYKCSTIAVIIHSTSLKVRQIILELRRRFVGFFEITVHCA